MDRLLKRTSAKNLRIRRGYHLNPRHQRGPILNKKNSAASEIIAMAVSHSIVSIYRVTQPCHNGRRMPGPTPQLCTWPATSAACGPELRNLAR